MTRDAAAPGRSRVTATLRLATALWLIGWGLWVMADPPRASAMTNDASFGALLPAAGLSFALGCFLATGFMSRVAGLLLAGLALWEIGALGPGPAPVALAVIGVYLVLRGGGAWAMDIYVQKMQDRVRRREAMTR
jgi:uncharacterized membrane protein YphA (DoxX/SURF4 family)